MMVKGTQLFATLSEIQFGATKKGERNDNSL
jgi:hypothetical protein